MSKVALAGIVILLLTYATFDFGKAHIRGWVDDIKFKWMFYKAKHNRYK